MGQFGVGQSVRRTEDNRFVIGKGRYTDDIKVEGVAQAYMLRSPFAHARITSVDVGDAKTAPGVIAVYTGADVAAAKLAPIVSAMSVPGRDGQPSHGTRMPLIASERVMYAGDTVAMIVAETVDQAKDAADLIMIDYDELPVVIDMEKAAAPDSPVLWPEFKTNVLLDWDFGDAAAVDAAFAKAAHVTRLKLINNRVSVNSMEPRAALVSYDAATGRYEMTVGTQGVHFIRNFLAGSLGVGPDKVRVKTFDTGGGFGLKFVLFPEYPLIAWASKQLGRPVKWIGERSDAFLTDYPGRDHITEAAIAFDESHHIMGVKVETLANIGGYQSLIGIIVPSVVPAGMHTGVYRVPHLYNRVRCMATNTTPTGAYRGAGRPEASYVIERLMDTASRELKVSPVELRRRNFVPTASIPYTTPSGVTFDSGDFERVLADAVKAADWDGFEARRAEKAKRGLLSGIGLAYYVERTPSNTDEFARITIHADETVTLSAGTQNHGQGHETAWAQILSDKLGIDFDKIRVLPGDTDLLASGNGTGGSRSLYVASGAIARAGDDVIAKGREIAANELEAAAADIVYENGRFVIAGTDREISLFDVAKLAEGPAAGLVGDGTWMAESGTMPNGCHICEVDIDRETGAYEVVRYTSMDDFGRILNPLLVEGQVHGGIVQGLGQAMGEHAVYDPESGQLVTGSFMDYWMPRAHNMPKIDFQYREILCKVTPLGTKGAGEAGTVGAAQALVNAVVDALREFGVLNVNMPITPYKLWQILHGKS